MPTAYKNDCPLCGQQKTSWSEKCADCENDRKRILAATAREQSDRNFLTRYQNWSLSQIGTELHVSRERARQLKRNAQRRQELLGVA
jgi:DNA-directed RNA polymerase sigma subunit (sigma70/sigma32)